jgi:iron complex outermembrane receptor protein
MLNLPSFAFQLKSSFLLVLLCAGTTYAQTKVSGKIVDAFSQEPLLGVSIQVKGKVAGTITDANGRFSLYVESAPPFVLLVSSVGYETQDVAIEGGLSNVEVKLKEQVIFGKEVVVSASRIEESVLKSPVTIERMDVRAIRETPQISFYDALQNLKGVEMSTQSLTLRTVSTRGFGANGNTRVVQLMDGMDNQAPGLSFPVGNVAGMSELDVESVEILPGAASALYGPNAINGLILMNSKSPFTYQGLSAAAKSGVMSASNRDEKVTPFYDIAVRYAKSFNNRLAFKVNASYVTAQDWQATDYRDQSLLNGATLENNVGNVRNNPYYDGINWMGDLGVNVYDILYANGMPGNGTNGTSAALGAIYSTQIPMANNLTLPQLLGGQTEEDQIAIARTIFSQAVPQYYLNAPGYSERSLTDYPSKSLKLNAAVHYRINDNLEAIIQGNWGRGSTVYTAVERFNIQNFMMGQYKAELKGSNFYLRGYMTHENSGDAHALGTLGSFLSERYLTTALSTGLPTFMNNALSSYGAALLAAYEQAVMSGLPQDQAVQVAVQGANAYAGANNLAWMNTALAPGLAAAQRQYGVGGTEFQSSISDIKTRAIPNGAKFLDKSSLYNVEGMYNFNKLIDPKVADLIIGGNYRVFALNSEGTLFATKENGDEYSIREFGAYAQAAKTFADVFKLTASVRYDKNENFKGQFSPRVSGVFTVAEHHNFRASFQRGFRIPTTQNQYIDLTTPVAHLVGGLPLFRDRYNMINNPVYAVADLEQGKVEPYRFKEWQPERVETYEIGYKSVIGNRLYVDAFYYYNRFLTFDGVAIVVQKKDQNGPVSDLTNPSKSIVYSMPVNSEQVVKNSGWGIGADYLLGRGFTFSGNLTQNKLLNDEDLNRNDASFFTYFNTPKYRYNLALSNRDINRTGWGFSVNFRYQTSAVWQSAMGSLAANIARQTKIPAYSTLDAQVSKKVSSLKSIIKVGGTNLTGKLYRTGWGNPSVGGMYYVSVTFDELLK